MGERTIITTIELTEVIKDMPKEFEFDKKAQEEHVKSKIKAALNVDDVVVTNVQEFIQG